MPTLKHKLSKMISATLLVALLALSGADVRELIALKWDMFTPAKVEASGEYGKTVRTAEFLLGGGTDVAVVTSTTLSYAGVSSWVAGKPAYSSSPKVKLQGSNIRVLSAKVDLSYELSNNAAHYLYRSDLLMDVEHSVSAGSDRDASDITSRANATTNPILGNSAGLMTFMGAHDVTGFFTTQSDAEFNSGVGVIAGIRHTGTVSRHNTNAKLTVTYEAYIPTTSGQSLTKTVRLPLDSTNGADSGTRRATCATNTTCSFNLNLASVPDLTTANLVSAFVELDLTRIPSTAVSIAANMGGAATTSYVLPTIPSTGYRAAQKIYYPITPGSLGVGAVNTFNVANAAAGSQALYGLGGEVVLTYSYDTSAPQQAETVRFMAYQGSGTAAANTNVNMGSFAPNVVNSGAVPKHAWYRFSVPLSTSATFSATSTVGSNIRGQSFSLALAGTRSGNTPEIIHDFSSDLTTLGTNVTGAYRFSAANPQVSAEMFVTFVWDGTASSARTNSITFPASSHFVAPAAAVSMNEVNSTNIIFAEAGQKTIRSAYLATTQERGDGTPATSGTYTATIQGQPTSIAEPAVATGKEYSRKFLIAFPSNVFGASAFRELSFAPQIVQRNTAGDSVYYASDVVVTYDASVQAESIKERSLHTIEYALGGGSDATGRATGVQTYAGSSWGTTKGAAGTKLIQIQGSNTRVVSAYIDVSFKMSAAVTINTVTVTGDATDGTTTFTDLNLTDLPTNGATDAIVYNSGTTAADASTGFHRMYDAKALLGNYNSQSLSTGVSVDIGILVANAAANREITNTKLVVTYAVDEDLNRVGTQTIMKTVRFPLPTRTAGCTNCSMTYTASIGDFDGTAASIVDVHYEVTVTSYGASTTAMTLSVNGASSAAFPRSEPNTDITTVKLFWSPPVGSGNGFWPNTSQTVALAQTNGAIGYGVGGEAVVTYKAYTGAARATETVTIPIGQVPSTVTATTTIGTGSLALGGSGVSVKNIWIRVKHPISNNGTLSIGGKVGSAALRNQGYAYGTAATVRGTGVPMIFHDLTADSASLVGTTSIVANFAHSNAATAATYLNAEALVTYEYDGGVGGAVTRTVEFTGTPSGVVAVASKPRARTIPYALPENVELTFMGADLRVDQIQNFTASGNITSASVHSFFVGGTSTTVTGSGGNEVYTPTFLIPMTESQMFGSGIKGGVGAVEFSTYSSVANNMQGSAVLSMTYIETHDIARPGYDQAAYHFYVDNNALTPTSTWSPGYVTLGENASISSSSRPVRTSDNVRLRMAIGISTTTLGVGMQAFALEFAPKVTSCSAAVGWTQVEGSGGGSVWRGVSAAPAGGATLTSFLMSQTQPGGAGVYGTYEEGGTSSVNPNSATPGQYVEYDWNIRQVGATPDSEYCFRMVRSDGTPLDVYTNFPSIYVAPYTPETVHFRWYTDALNETPSVPAASVDAPAPSVTNGSPMKLRIGLEEVAGVAGSDENYILQWSQVANFAGVNPVLPQSRCTATSTFCYYNGGGGDGAALGASVLGFGYGAGVHIESTSTLFSAAANSSTEIEFTIQANLMHTGQLYYFRLYDAKRGRVVGYSSNVGAGNPGFTAEGATLSLSISGVNAGVPLAGIVTTATTTATSVPLGVIKQGSDTILAHQISVQTNAMQGYRLGLKFLSDLVSDTGGVIATSSAGNLTPGAWSTVCPSASVGCFGYHTTDGSLAGGSTRFAPNDTWAGPVARNDEEISYSAYPTSTVRNIIYRVRDNGALPAGSFAADLVYIVTPTY